MTLLLDTHTFLWWDGNRTRLSPSVLALCQDPATKLWLSVASLWEIQIKTALGKLSTRIPLLDIIREQEAKNRLQLLPIKVEHVLALAGLPDLHRDPFDRILIAQATVEGATIATSDEVMQRYPASVIW